MEPGSATTFGPSWFTPPASAATCASGWAPLDDTYEIAYLCDSRTDRLFARLSYRGALDVAARENAGLITPAQVKQLQERGIVVSPVFLPDAEIRAAAAGILARRPGESPADWDQRLRTAGMTTLTWAIHHDSVFWSRLKNWPAGTLVAGAGKHWVAGAPAGRAWLMGWWNGSSWIQGEPHPGDAGFHDDGHHDYATTTILVRRRDGGPMPQPKSGGLVKGGGAGLAATGTRTGWIVAGLAGLAGVSLAGWYIATHWPAIKRRIG